MYINYDETFRKAKGQFLIYRPVWIDPQSHSTPHFILMRFKSWASLFEAPDPSVCFVGSVMRISALATFRVYSDWTQLRQFDGVKHDAPVLEQMLFNRSIQTGIFAAKAFLWHNKALADRVWKIGIDCCVTSPTATRFICSQCLTVKGLFRLDANLTA